MWKAEGGGITWEGEQVRRRISGEVAHTKVLWMSRLEKDMTGNRFPFSPNPLGWGEGAALYGTGNSLWGESFMT